MEQGKASDHPAAAKPSSAVPGSDTKVPEQSAEDTDSAWGGRPDPGDDERLYGDRPPHWDSI